MLRKSEKPTAAGRLIPIAVALCWPAFAQAEAGAICSPAQDADLSATPIDCFVASVGNHNRITLHWRVRDARSQVYISDELPPAYRDPGYQRPYCVEVSDGTCSLELTRTEPGLYRWKLESRAGGATFSAIAEVELSPIAPPLVSGGGFVDVLRPSEREIRWEAPAPFEGAPHWVEVRTPQVGAWLKQRFPPRGEGALHRIPGEAFRHRGELAFAVRTCSVPPGSSAKFCSPPMSVGFNVGNDYFMGIRNRHVERGQALSLAFTERSGDVRYLSISGPPGASPLPDRQRVSSPVQIPAEALSYGRYTATLDSCTLAEDRCTNKEAIAHAQAAGVFWQRRPGPYKEGEVIGTLHHGDPQTVTEVVTARGGEIAFPWPAPVRAVAQGEAVAYRVDGHGDVLHIYVGPQVEWEIGRPYSMDFQQGLAVPMRGAGQPLDITFDGRGGVWMLNEFSNGLEYLSPGDEATTIGAPLARHPSDQAASEGHALEATRPFHIAWEGGPDRRSTISPLAERITLIDGKLWFTQGGALSVPAASDDPNASRVVVFDPAIEDAADTAVDERFCVFNMPIDESSPRGDQQIVGIAAARGRIWVAETRGLTSEHHAYLSSFVPRQSNCANQLDFDDPQAVASQPLRYCTDFQTPEQDGCIDRRPLPRSLRAVKIAHLQADPAGETLWFTDASGQFLGHYDPSEEQGFQLHPLQETHYGEAGTVANLGGFLWNLAVTDDAVYAAEYATRHIIRLDKRRNRLDELSIPYEGRRMRLHSMAVDSLRERLWFTLANECAAPSGNAHSTIGYIDLDSWETHLDQPEQPPVRGVIYSGLEAIPQCEMRPGTHQSFRGIALEQATGRLALATMHRGQFTLLTPLPGFWP